MSVAIAEREREGRPRDIGRVVSEDLRVYCIPVESFPNHYTNVYLVRAGDTLAMIDLGSGWGESSSQLVKGIEEIRSRFGERVSLEEIDLLLITHGHVDHFGSLSFFRSRSNAGVGIHRLDSRQIINFEETILVVARDLRLFLQTTGIPEETLRSLMGMYTSSKNMLSSMPVDFYLAEEDPPLADAFRIWHVPGHCPGAVCIQVGDLLFTGDHLLSGITPHQSPEVIARYTGLGHYLHSLARVRAIPGLKKAFGGHQQVMEDPYGRAEAIEAFHRERLDRVLEICR